MIQWGSLTSSSWGSGSRGRGSANSWTDVGDQVLDVNTFEGLGEEARPVRLNINVGGLQESSELFSLERSLILKWKQDYIQSHGWIKTTIYVEIVKWLFNLRWWRLHHQPRWELRRRKPIQRLTMPLYRLSFWVCKSTGVFNSNFENKHKIRCVSLRLKWKEWCFLLVCFKEVRKVYVVSRKSFFPAIWIGGSDPIESKHLWNYNLKLCKLICILILPIKLPRFSLPWLIIDGPLVYVTISQWIILREDWIHCQIIN